MEYKTFQEIRDEIEAQIAHIRDPLFTFKAAPNPDWYLNAWLHTSWDTYATGYKRAADILVQYVADHGSDQDFLVYPTVFLYRQYLELRLKELIFMSSRLLDQDASMPKEHNLMSLWRKARPNLEAVWPDSHDKDDLDAVDDRLKELCAVDSGSYAFRYPQDAKGDPSLPGMQYINLKQLKEVIQAYPMFLMAAVSG